MRKWKFYLMLVNVSVVVLLLVILVLWGLPRLQGGMISSCGKEIFRASPQELEEFNVTLKGEVVDDLSIPAAQ